MNRIHKIIVHCSYTLDSMDIGVEEIRQWHTDPNKPGGPFRDIGYHWVIRRDGTVEAGRPENRTGAHTRGHNSNSIGVCLVGGMSKDGEPFFNFTRHQILALEQLISDITRRYPGEAIQVVGHRDFNGVKKACPCFDVRALLCE